MANDNGVRYSKDRTVLGHATGDVSVEVDTAGKKFEVLVGGTQLLLVNAAGVKATSGMLATKQAVTQVHDTTPTKAELTTALGDPATVGRGCIGTVDDNDGDTNGYICWASDANWYFLKGTKSL